MACLTGGICSEMLNTFQPRSYSYEKLGYQAHVRKLECDFAT
jgi:hypothetical protein